MNPPLLPVFSYTAVYAKTHASMQKASRALFLHAVIVDQTSFQDDLSFGIGHITKLQRDLFQRISNHIR